MMPKHYNISMEAIKAWLIPIETLYNTKAPYWSMEAIKALLIPIEILIYNIKVLYWSMEAI